MSAVARATKHRLLVLDVDGTISRVYREEETALHQQELGWRSWMGVDDEVVDSLDAVVRRRDARVAWLTTWPRDQLSWLIQDPLRGRLDGAYVPWQNWPHQGWRMQSLVSLLRSTRPETVVWADDRAPEGAADRLTKMSETPVFVVRPEKYGGLTLSDIDAIDSVFTNGA